MGTVHKLIQGIGIEAAKANATDPFNRQCIDTAFAVLSDEVRRIGVMHAGFAMTSLPHREIEATEWVRQGGNVKLRIESGKDVKDQHAGIPYGATARMILLFLQTEAVRTKSREVELGRNMAQWLATMGIEKGGWQYKTVRDQSKRISLCRLTFYRTWENATEHTNGSFVRNAISTGDESDNQLSLWREVVKLDEGFYESLLSHPMPVREAAIRELGGRSQAIDIYIWLGYRLWQIDADKPTRVSWPALFDQFGGGYSTMKHFKPKFREAFGLALAAYPEARAELDEAGAVLHYSPPPVPERLIAGR